MFFKRFQSLKFRLMLLITAILLMIVGFPVGFFVYQLDKNYYDFSINMIETTSQVVYQFIYNGMLANNKAAIQENLELLVTQPSIKLVRIYRPSGKILFSSARNEIQKNIKDLPEDVAFFRTDSGRIESFVNRGNVYSHLHPIYVEKECTSCHSNDGSLIAILDVHTSFTQSEQLYITAKKLVIFGGLMIIVILWILLNFLYQSQVETRLRKIIDGFERLATGDYNFKIIMPGQHELAILAKKFNKMVENLFAARQKEEQFLQEKLHRADRLITLGEITAEIAHEVNNPAGIILTRAECLMEEMKEQGPKTIGVEDLDIIIQQTERIADTTRSILQYSRKLPQTFSATDLNELIKRSLIILEPRITKNKVIVNLDLPNKPAIIWGNNYQLEQVFCNLINNSLDFVDPKKGVIHIEISKIQKNDKSIYTITYQDNGPGVPDKYQDKIFYPFFTTKDHDKGTGLGLFIVKNILSNHKGSIMLEKSNQSGVRFVIHLEVYDGKS
jgi:signal transduction histidine kinase